MGRPCAGGYACLEATDREEANDCEKKALLGRFGEPELGCAPQLHPGQTAGKFVHKDRVACPPPATKS
jgi:hypothetical protein